MNWIAQLSYVDGLIPQMVLFLYVYFSDGGFITKVFEAYYKQCRVLWSFFVPSW